MGEQPIEIEDVIPEGLTSVMPTMRSALNSQAYAELAFST